MAEPPPSGVMAAGAEATTIRRDPFARDRTHPRRDLLARAGHVEPDLLGARPEFARGCGARPSRGWVTWTRKSAQ